MPGLQARTKSRARRLGIDVKKKYTRAEAKTIRRTLRAEKASPHNSPHTGPLQGQTGTVSGNQVSPDGQKKYKAVLGPDKKPRRAVNTVASGAGSARRGKKYRVMQDEKGNYVHVYGRGKSAKKIRLRRKTAQAYGYGAPGS